MALVGNREKSLHACVEPDEEEPPTNFAEILSLWNNRETKNIQTTHTTPKPAKINGILLIFLNTYEDNILLYNFPQNDKLKYILSKIISN